VPVETEAGKKARHYLVGLPARYAKLAERVEAQLGAVKPRPISWLTGREVVG